MSDSSSPFLLPDGTPYTSEMVETLAEMDIHQAPDSPDPAPLGTLAWYEAHLARLAAAEQTACAEKLAKYGYGDEDVFAILRSAASRTQTSLWVQLLGWMDRCMRLAPDTPFTTRQTLLLDLFGYTCLGLALLTMTSSTSSGLQTGQNTSGHCTTPPSGA